MSGLFGQVCDDALAKANLRTEVLELRAELDALASAAMGQLREGTDAYVICRRVWERSHGRPWRDE